MACFEDCNCTCGKVSGEFDRIRARETRFTTSLQDICHSHVGWFSDSSLEVGHLLGDWEKLPKLGLYVLWHKNDYCPRHELFHMKALYVGKGGIRNRLADHWARKDFSDELLVYWSCVGMPNRQAKYYEQLLLDIYDLPFNSWENPGTETLCAHMTQSEVD